MSQTTAVATINHTPISRPAPHRDEYGALPRRQLPDAISAVLAAVKREVGIHEGIVDRNKRGGFDAMNVDVYGYDVDRSLIAIQIRHTWRKKQGYWTQQNKFYALAGVDDGQIFCHVVPTSFRFVRHLENKSPEDIVRWSESKIFRVPLTRLESIIRQGDVALIPVRSIPRTAEALDEKRIVLRDSHTVEVDGTFYRDAETGRTWANGLVQIGHEPGQHRPVDAEGRHEVVVGRRINVDFNTID